MSFQMLTPTVSLKPKVFDENKPREVVKQKIIQHQPIAPIIANSTTINEWEEFLSIEDEYNPAVPSRKQVISLFQSLIVDFKSSDEYEKIVKERRERNKKEDVRKRHRSPSPTFRGKSGFGGRQNLSDEEESFRPAMASNRVGTGKLPNANNPKIKLIAIVALS